MKILYTWGKGKSGNTCHNLDKKTPSAPSVLLSLNIDKISMGANHSAAIVNSECLMWGEVMGRKHTTLFKIVWKKKVESVSCGFNHTLLLTNEHKIYSMGLNQQGQLGIENIVDSAVPLPIDSLNQKHNIIRITAGNCISAAITDTGDLYTWGNNQNGQLGNGKFGAKSNQALPATVQAPQESIYSNLQWSQIVFGQSHVLAMTSTGILFVWGSNEYGQLGLGHTNPKYVPVRCTLPPALGENMIITDISCGLNHSALLTLDGDVYMWGSNEYGQIGQGEHIEHSFSPIRVKNDLEYKKITRIALGSNHSLVLAKDQDVYTFGLNDAYQLGLGSKEKNKKFHPTLIMKPRIKAIDIFAAGDCSALFELVNTNTAITNSITSSLLNGNQQAVNSPSTQGPGLGKKFAKNNLTIFVGTWNCNAKRSVNLGNWLLSNSISADIVAIGLQEIVDMKASAIVKATSQDKKNNKENAYHPWKHDIEQTLSLSSGRYVKVLSKVLVGLMLLVYVKEEHAPYVHDPYGSMVACGVMGKIGNKGAVGVRFTLYQTGICFINSHLAAGPSSDRNERRAADFKKIQMMTFENQMSILDHESLIWFGDLNYRIDLPFEEAKHQVLKRNYAYLQQFDQLNNERKAGRAFIGFNEEPLNFQPTYKYDIGTNVYDTSEKNRTPSWCDRILYRGESLKQINYSRHELNESDHRPVSAIFLLEIKHAIPKGKAWNLNNILKMEGGAGMSPAAGSPLVSLNGSGKIMIGMNNVSPDVRSSSSPQLPSSTVIGSYSSTSSISSMGSTATTTSSSTSRLPSLPLPPLPPKIKKKETPPPFIIGSLPNNTGFYQSQAKKRLSYSDDDISHHVVLNSVASSIGSSGNSINAARLLSNHRKIKNSIDLPSLINSNGSIDIEKVKQTQMEQREHSCLAHQDPLASPRSEDEADVEEEEEEIQSKLVIIDPNDSDTITIVRNVEHQIDHQPQPIIGFNEPILTSSNEHIVHDEVESFLDSDSDTDTLPQILSLEEHHHHHHHHHHHVILSSPSLTSSDQIMINHNSPIHLEDLPLNFNLIDDHDDEFDIDLKDFINENYISSGHEEDELQNTATADNGSGSHNNHVDGPDPSGGEHTDVRESSGASTLDVPETPSSHIDLPVSSHVDIPIGGHQNSSNNNEKEHNNQQQQQNTVKPSFGFSPQETSIEGDTVGFAFSFSPSKSPTSQVNGFKSGLKLNDSSNQSTMKPPSKVLLGNQRAKPI